MFSFKNGANKTYVFQVRGDYGASDLHLYDAVSDGGYAGYFAKAVAPRPLGKCIAPRCVTIRARRPILVV